MFFSLLAEEDDKDHQSTTDLQTRSEHDNLQDVPQSSSAAIDLWVAQERDIRKLQHESKDLQPILNWLEDGILPPSDKEARQLILKSEHFQMVYYIIYTFLELND